jgi:hypothetical protein
MAGAIALVVTAVLGPPALAQVKPGSQQWLGLMGADIPPILQQARADPYRAAAEPACETIPREIMALNEALGPDVDALKTRTGARQMAAGYVRGMVPYRGVVRFLTGADGKDKKLQAAATAGYARRGFLRGLEASLHCAPPEPQATPANTQVAEATTAGDAIAATLLQPASAPGEAENDATAPTPPAPEAGASPYLKIPVFAAVSDPRR